MQSYNFLNQPLFLIPPRIIFSFFLTKAPEITFSFPQNLWLAENFSDSHWYLLSKAPNVNWHKFVFLFQSPSCLPTVCCWHLIFDYKAQNDAEQLCLIYWLWQASPKKWFCLRNRFLERIFPSFPEYFSEFFSDFVWIWNEDLFFLSVTSTGCPKKMVHSNFFTPRTV